MFKLVLFGAGRSLDAPALRAVADRFGVPLLERLPSRHPDRRDLAAALRTTRTGRGSWNKTRAATYLGWDPDTLVARLEDAGLGSDPDPDSLP